MADTKISALPSATTPLAGTEVLPIVQGGTTDQVSVSNLTAGRNVTMAKVAVGVSSGNEKIQTNGTVRSTGDYLSNEASAATFGFTTDSPGPGAFVVSHGANTTTRGTFRVILRASDGVATTSQLIPISVSNVGDVSVGVGNLVIGTSGKGIDFSATSGAGTSELLADYEEGTWTPVVRGGSTAGTYTYGEQAGSYTKIGNQVTVWCSLVNIATSSAGTGSLTITGLPFTVANNNAFTAGAPGSLYIRQLAAAVTGAKGTYALPGKNGTTVYCVYFDGTSTVDFSCTDISSGATDIGFQFSYFV